MEIKTDARDAVMTCLQGLKDLTNNHLEELIKNFRRTKTSGFLVAFDGTLDTSPEQQKRIEQSLREHLKDCPNHEGEDIEETIRGLNYNGGEDFAAMEVIAPCTNAFHMSLTETLLMKLDDDDFEEIMFSSDEVSKRLLRCVKRRSEAKSNIMDLLSD